MVFTIIIIEIIREQISEGVCIEKEERRISSNGIAHEISMSDPEFEFVHLVLL